MIIITSENKDREWCVGPGDEFRLSLKSDLEINGQLCKSSETVLSEKITVNKIINYICTFRFANEDGTLIGFHLAGFFGNKDNLPEDIKTAKRLNDLTKKQRKNFDKSAGVLLK